MTIYWIVTVVAFLVFLVVVILAIVFLMGGPLPFLWRYRHLKAERSKYEQSINLRRQLLANFKQYLRGEEAEDPRKMY